MRKNKLIAILLLLALVWISLYKDDITPDFMNTSAAAFLNPESGHSNDESHILFWIIAIAYSLSFVFIPYLIVYLWFDKKTALIALGLLILFLLFEYGLVLSRSSTLMVHILPKVNRYFHSPILTFFFIALFTLNNRNNESAKPTV